MTDRRLHESGGPDGGTRGGYIDSFENMPGAQHQPFGAKPPKAFVPALGMSLDVEIEASIAGIVCDVSSGPLHEAAIVVKLDGELETKTQSGRRVAGSWLVLEPGGSPARWRRTGMASVELWSAPPSTDPWLDAHPGSLISATATYDFGDG
ncbi:MAG: hypothetical protein AAGA37_13200 [Actinomycetota bacterium]